MELNLFSINKGRILKIHKYKCLAIILIIPLVLSACSTETNIPPDILQDTEEDENKSNINTSKEDDNNKSTKDIEKSVNINGGKTIEESMDYYVQKIEASKYLSSAFYSGKYKIIDTEETSNKLNVYAHVVSRWVNENGDTVSAGSGVVRIGFRKDDNSYRYLDNEAKIS